MNAPRFDPLIHEPSRLQICGALRSLDEAEFSVLRDMLNAADSVVSKHLKALEDAGYVSTRKLHGDNGRRRTWVRLSGTGRRAFDAHVAQLRQIAGDGWDPTPERTHASSRPSSVADGAAPATTAADGP
ncbi:MAG TPA: transcriptional regulator [Miltoncostaeales bacterium]|jgi:DNA-binding MarR family transcriptional regulator|nr:transcriptional regulator [Miltoncostaeales bacterium]